MILGPPATFGGSFPFVILAPLTTVRRGLSLHVEIEPSPDTGLDEVSYVQCELLRSVSRARLIHRLGSVAPNEGSQVHDVVKTLLNH